MIKQIVIFIFAFLFGFKDVSVNVRGISITDGTASNLLDAS
ncbi:hypothetical protein tinsulaeT_30160 [Thalassotalea insulae]|uniref:Uncharacterized protein n=1 Tax=Thalassotalea insulae TaxID=2056778 RepID=A0ABQ6GUQ9_9GAMM|nr:hypothetical protein tinsulaeT_30160 [Thalassotalea insulae]